MNDNFFVQNFLGNGVAQSVTLPTGGITVEQALAQHFPNFNPSNTTVTLNRGNGASIYRNQPGGASRAPAIPANFQLQAGDLLSTSSLAPTSAAYSTPGDRQN